MIFSHYKEIQDIETGIIRAGIALGIDFNSPAEVKTLVKEAVSFKLPSHVDTSDRKQLSKIELFGLIQLMLAAMKESAEDGFMAHGGATWKIIGKALYEETQNS